jgi:hypothetical protein
MSMAIFLDLLDFGFGFGTVAVRDFFFVFVAAVFSSSSLLFSSSSSSSSVVGAGRLNYTCIPDSLNEILTSFLVVVYLLSLLLAISLLS